MRKSTLSEQEIAEFDDFQKKETRKGGLNLMPVRDRGSAVMSNGSRVRWHTSNPPKQSFEIDGKEAVVTSGTIPDGMFEINGVIFNAEELMRHLRWA